MDLLNRKKVKDLETTIKDLNQQIEILMKDCNEAEKHNRKYLELVKIAEDNTNIRESIVKAKETLLKDAECEIHRLKDEINKLREYVAKSFTLKKKAEMERDEYYHKACLFEARRRTSHEDNERTHEQLNELRKKLNE